MLTGYSRFNDDSLFAVVGADRVYQAIFLINNFSYLVLRLYLVIVIGC